MFLVYGFGGYSMFFIISTGTISWTVFSSSIFVLVALVLSMYLIFEHLAAYNQPEEQKFLIGLILMVPVYALESVRDAK
ncbi:hypothetical protein RJT34_09486 [Clitoria ternatea]|uniref:Uncharacterized protein n=1 Tax=Clitoria ternatea TaxID=43366 RepID=A0AAN9PS29_CLITE